MDDMAKLLKQRKLQKIDDGLYANKLVKCKYTEKWL